MNPTRIGMYEQELNSPRGQIDALWRRSMQPMSTNNPAGVLDEQKSDLHEEVAHMKQWADSQHATTGVYPDDEILKFLAKLT